MEAPKLTTEGTYKNVLTTRGLSVDVESFDDFSLCWIGSKNAKQVIVYVCGGALLIHAYDAHIIHLVNGYETMKVKNQDVSIVIVAYSLCPASPYPTQVRQMASTVQHLLKSRAPETIHLSGDSAGATLVLALLLHHLHPHPLVPSYNLPAGSSFGTALLISPGAPVPGILDTASPHQDPNPDYIKPEMIDIFWGMIKGTALEGVEMPNPWIDSLNAPEDWWKGLPVGDVKIIVGGAEILRDSIAIWTGHLKKYHNSPVEVNIFPGETHEQSIIGLVAGVSEEIASTKYWRKWFEDFRS